MNDLTGAGSPAPLNGEGLRIGLATPAWPGTIVANGIASAVAPLAAGLQAIGHRVTILAHWIDAPHDDPNVISLPPRPTPLVERALFRIMPDHMVRRGMIAKLVAATRRAIAEQGIQVLVMEESFGWAGALRRAVPIPVVATLHGPYWLHRSGPGRPARGPDARREAWEAEGLRNVDAIIAPSHAVLDRTRAEWGLPDVPTAVIGNPVSLVDPVPAAVRSDTPQILFVGRFDRIKGADVVLDAFARVASRHPDCRLTFVGPDEGLVRADGSRLHVKQAIAALPAGVRSRIDVLGRKSRAEVAALRRSHPITLIASRYETFGVALIEAMVAGAAVISTRVGGCAEILRDGETGLLVPPEDPQAMAEACLRLLADPALARQLGQSAQSDIAARFAPQVIAREVASFLAPICRPRE